MHARRKQEYFEGTAEDSSGKRSGRKGESWRESPQLPRESIANHEQDVSRNTNVKAYSFKVLGKKNRTCFWTMVERWSLLKNGKKNKLDWIILCSTVLWRVKLGIIKIRYLTGEDF